MPYAFIKTGWNEAKNGFESLGSRFSLQQPIEFIPYKTVNTNKATGNESARLK